MKDTESTERKFSKQFTDRLWLGFCGASVLLALFMVTPVGQAQVSAFDRWMRTFDTVAAATQSNLARSIYSTIYILGYHAANDGGGGVFHKVDNITSTNLGTKIFSGTAGKSWERMQNGEEVLVAWFGTADFTASLQAALDFANGTRVVRAQAGSHTLTATINVQNNTTLRGDPNNKTTLTTSMDAPMFSLGIASDPVAPTLIYHITLEGLRLFGNTTGASQTGIYYSGAKQVNGLRIFQVEIAALGGNGIELETTGGIVHTEFENLELHGIMGYAVKRKAEYDNGAVWKNILVYDAYEGIHFLPTAGSVNGAQAHHFIACNFEGNGRPVAGTTNLNMSAIKSEHNWFQANLDGCYFEGNGFFDNEPDPAGHNLWASNAVLNIRGGVFASAPYNILVQGDSHVTADGVWVQNTTATPAKNKGAFINDGGTGAFFLRNLKLGGGYTDANIAVLLNGATAKRHVSLLGNGGYERLQVGNTPSSYGFLDQVAGSWRFYNAANPQSLELYKSNVGADAEYFGALWSGANLILGTFAGGAGVLRDMYLNAQTIYLRTAGSDRVAVDNTGQVLPVVDNTQDLGSTGNRWRSLHAGTEVKAPTVTVGTTNVAGALAALGASLGNQIEAASPATAANHLWASDGADRSAKATGVTVSGAGLDHLTASNLEATNLIVLAEVDEPATPTAGSVYLYSKNTGDIYLKNSSGSERNLTDVGSGGGDAAAIHDNVSGEIAGVAAKGTPVAADYLLIEDSEAGNAKKSITLGALEAPLESFLDLSDLQGAVTDAQVPNNITVDLATLATTATTANAVANNSVTGAGLALASQAAGDIMYYDGTDWVRLAKGTAGQVLEMNAGATAPEWDTDDTGGGGSALNVQEEDGSPTGTPGTLKFANGSVTDNGDGSYSIANGGGGGSATEFDDIADPSGNGAVALGNTTHAWASTLDSGIVLELYDTDADAANTTTLLKLGHNDSADPHVIYLWMESDRDGTPSPDFVFSQTGFTSSLLIHAPTFDVGFSDTTISRASAGVIAVEGNTLATVGGAIGAATATTPSAGDNDDSVATTEFVRAAGNEEDVTLTDAATIATDCSLGRNFTVTLGGNRTLGAPTNGDGGRYYQWEVIQDATGSRTLGMATNFVFGSDITGITLTTNPNYRDFIRAKCDKNNTAVFRVIGFVRGYQ